MYRYIKLLKVTQMNLLRQKYNSVILTSFSYLLKKNYTNAKNKLPFITLKTIFKFIFTRVLFNAVNVLILNVVSGKKVTANFAK